LLYCMSPKVARFGLCGNVHPAAPIVADRTSKRRS